MDRETIKRTSGVARIRLDDDETERFKKEIDELFVILDPMNNAPACNDFLFNPVEVSDALRDDIPVIDGSIEEMLKSMSTYDGYVRGPKIV